MAWNRTLAELVSDVRTRSDTLGRATRHPDAMLQRFIGESYRSLVNRATAAGSTAFCSLVTLEDTTRAAGDTGGVTLRLQKGSGASAESLQPPVLTLRIYQNGGWSTLPMVSLQEAMGIIDATKQGTFAACWAIQEAGMEVFGEIGSSSQGVQSPLLLFAPTLPVGAVVKVLVPIYVQSVDDLATGYTFQLNEYGYEWLIYDVCVKLASRDAELGGQGQLWMSERDRAWRDFADQIQSAKSGPSQRDVVRTPRMRRPLRWP